MKLPAGWIELPLVAGGLMAGMLVVMWAQRPAGGCELSLDARRPLVLSRQTDREHLSTEVAAAGRVARRYMSLAAEPSQQRTRFLECEATLVRQIAARHGLSADRVRAGADDAP